MALTARQRAQQELLKTEAARIDAETPANTEDVINARYTGYSGGYQFVTVNGGTVTAINTSNGSPLIGESYQLSRDRSSGAFEFAAPARVQVQAGRSRYNPNRPEDLNGLIESPSAQNYTLIYSSRTRTKVGELFVSSNHVAVTVPAQDSVLEVGDTLELSVTTVGTGALAFTVELKRIG